MWRSEKLEGQLIKTEVGDIAFGNHYDVIVVGLGAAGAVTCVAAAQKKFRVLGLDRMHCMGGMATAGSVIGYYFGNRGGMYETLDERSLIYNGSVYTFSGGSFGAESKKYVLEDEAVKNGATLCYESVCIGVYLEGKRVKGIRYLTPEGIKDASCTVLVDGTGNADICDMAGCETVTGRGLDGRTQPFTSVRGYITENRIKSTNTDCGVVDPADSAAMSRAILYSHADHWKKGGEKEKNSFLYLAPLLGIREGRRIVGEEMPRVKDFFADKMTEKPVFYAYADLDKHGLDNAFESEEIQNWWVCANLGAVNISFPVAFGSFIPRGFDGILAVGRCLSHDRDLSSCVRMMRDMQKSGEVAAAAAAIAIRRGCRLREIPYEELKAELVKTGCLDEKNNQGYNFEIYFPVKITTPISWLKDETEIRAGLDSECPGVAIWSCFRLGSSLVGRLKVWMEEGGENLRKHSAIALGLLGDTACLPVLREMIRERDSFMPKDCRKHNQIRGFIAICLVGKLKDWGAVEMLTEIVTSPEEFHKPVYHSYPKVEEQYQRTGYHNTYYQFVSHSVRSLIRLGDEIPSLRQEIARAFGLVKAREMPGAPEGKAICVENPDAYFRYLMTEAIVGVMDRTLAKWEGEKA